MNVGRVHSVGRSEEWLSDHPPPHPCLIHLYKDHAERKEGLGKPRKWCREEKQGEKVPVPFSRRRAPVA